MRHLWIISSLLLGLIPLIDRLLVYLLSSHSCSIGFIFNPIDISFLALSLNWANISESFHLFFAKKRQKQSTLLNKRLIVCYLAASVVFIIIVAGVLMCLYLAETNPDNTILNPKSTLICVSAISLISIFLSYIFIDKINVILYGNK